jgi:SAM-dependent methyltransferase
LRRDPEEAELRQLLRHAPVEGRRVLDIGCGDGDLTWRLARRAGLAVALDPAIAGLRTARLHPKAEGPSCAATPAGADASGSGAGGHPARTEIGARSADSGPGAQPVRTRVHFAGARGQALPLVPGHFDLAFFTSSF